jgi:hypothetical protein
MRIWLEDAAGKSVTSRDVQLGNGYPVTSWQSNQYVRDWPTVRVPANLADGRYSVKLAAARGNEMLGIGWLPFGGTVAKLGQIEIRNRPRVTDASPVPHPLEVIFEGKMKLLGYDLTRNVPERGVRLTLYWRSLSTMDTAYSVFVHLLDDKNTILASADSEPGGGHFPTTGWIEGEFITDIHSFTLPPDLPDGGYPIEIGLYDPETGIRLKTAKSQDYVIPVSVNLP